MPSADNFETPMAMCFECRMEITGWVEQEMGLCTRCQREAMDRKDHQAALLGADLALKNLNEGRYAQRALDAALARWFGRQS